MRNIPVAVVEIERRPASHSTGGAVDAVMEIARGRDVKSARQ
jgi:hypothetical protein